MIPDRMVFMALCGPKSCTDEDYNEVYSDLSDNNITIRELMNPDSYQILSNVIDQFYNYSRYDSKEGYTATSESLNIVRLSLILKNISMS